MNKTGKAPSFILLAAASIALTIRVPACNQNQPTPDNSAQNQPAQPDQTQPADQSQDPASASNLAPASDTQATEPQTTANNERPYGNDRGNRRNRGNRRDRAYRNDSNGDSYNDYDDEDSSYGQPVLYASQPPPPLPEYSQPDCPGDGYIWTPGYWSYSSGGYYWVPGAWTQPPEVGLLWTPGFWA